MGNTYSTARAAHAVRSHNNEKPTDKISRLHQYQHLQIHGYPHRAESLLSFSSANHYLEASYLDVMPSPFLQTIELPYFENSALLFSAFCMEPYAIFLDSCTDQRHSGDSDIIAAKPNLRFISAHCHDWRIENASGDVLESASANTPPLQRLLALEKECAGSLMGHLGYHCNDAFFGLASHSENTEENTLPDICMGIYQWRIETDHKQKTTTLKYVKNAFDKTTIDTIIETIKNQYLVEQPEIQNQIQPEQKAHSNFSKESYFETFAKIRHYIEAGDCYQVNLAQRFTLPFNGDSWQQYCYLREHSPAPYACYFNTTFGQILSFSPESFLKINRDGHIVTQPIKGTRKRHADKKRDELAALELTGSKKDQAENLMIVDLLRNDLSKSAELNSVEVRKLFEIQSFANVHHMVSEISAQKLATKSPLEVLINCFPGGSITGAPKKRAMEIIRELEPDARQIYCGALGQINLEGELSFNIAIRTLVIKNGTLYCWGGGGLVSDSDAQTEYEESLIKISNLIPI